MAVSHPPGFSPSVVKQGFGSGSISTYTIALEAWRRGLKVSFLDHISNRFEISDGGRHIALSQSWPISLTSSTDLKKLVNKDLTKQLMRANGSPSPEGILIDTKKPHWDKIEAFAQHIGYPLVLKPNAGSTGRGVLTRINSWEELVDGYNYLASELAVSSIVLERHYEGNDFRILVIGERAVAACKRIPANVTGNGVETVRELINAKNATRAANPFLSKGTIDVDYEVMRRLFEENLTLDSIPVDGRYIALRRAANASAGGDVIDVTDTLPGPILDAAVRAVLSVPNIFIAGVDVIYKEGSAPTYDNFTILEMNPRPQIGVNMYPTEGVGRDVPRAYVDFLFPHSQRPTSGSDEMLAFELTLIKPALRSGFAESVTIPPLPEHRFRIRQLFVYSHARSGPKLNRVQRDRILRIVREESLAGHLKSERDALHLLVCGGSDASVSRLRKYCEEVLEIAGSDECELLAWEEAVTTGFRIDPKV